MYFGGNNNYIIHKITPPNPANFGPRLNIKLPAAPFAPLPEVTLQRYSYAKRYDCESGSSESSQAKDTDKIEELIDVLDKNGIKVKKLETKDGYFIINKSLADIFKEAGVDSDIFDYKDYDDWYITGLTQRNGSTIYSMIKVREPMDKKGRTGTAVVFSAMAINPFKKIISDSKNGIKPDESTIYQVSQSVEQIVHANKYATIYNKTLLNYFKDPKSKGSYLIADFMIDKTAHDEAFGDGTFELPFAYDDFDIGGQDTLDRLEDEGIYHKETNAITIKNPDQLTIDERVALLLISTGDKDIYAYSGENKFHADAYNLPFYESHAIKSDAGVGEAKNNDGMTWYEGFFKYKFSPYRLIEYAVYRVEE